jgi:hypothetical protein
MSLFRRKTENPRSAWDRKQDVAAPSRYYGNGGTIHGSVTIDVRVKDGHVTEVWYRCQQLPFRVLIDGLATGYGSTDDNLPAITGVEVFDR